MAKIIFLGTAAAVANAEHENTHLAVITDHKLLLIDCPGNPVVRLQQAGITPTSRLTDLFLTHFHPDHSSGLPLLLQTLWLLGRTTPLHLHGSEFTMRQSQRMLKLYDWETWSEMFPVVFHEIPEEEMYMVLDTDEMRLYTSPVSHYVPTLGARIELPDSQHSLAFSSDTRPCPEMARLADGVNILIHEATGEHFGHSSAAQAGEIARQAKAVSLYLIHYPVWQTDPAKFLIEAKATFGGEVHLAQDYQSIDI
jgi:ribonuclease Z